jgi:hypothetical protein
MVAAGDAAERVQTAAGVVVDAGGGQGYRLATPVRT